MPAGPHVDPLTTVSRFPLKGFHSELRGPVPVIAQSISPEDVETILSGSVHDVPTAGSAEATGAVSTAAIAAKTVRQVRIVESGESFISQHFPFGVVHLYRA